MSDFAGAVGMLVFSFWVLLMVNGCAHRHITTPRKDEEGAYVRCLECSARLPQPQWDEA